MQSRGIADRLQYLSRNYNLNFVHTSHDGRTLPLPLAAETLAPALLGLGYSLGNLLIETARIEHFVTSEKIPHGSTIDLTDWLDKKRSSAAVYGGLLGDEGKGAVARNLCDWIGAEFAVKYQGGPQAGTVLDYRGEKVALNLLPAGIFCDSVKEVVLAQGLNLNLDTLLTSLQYLERLSAGGKLPGFDLGSKTISASGFAHVIMPWHIHRSIVHSGFGTSGKGNGAAQADRYDRKGLQLQDLLRPTEGAKERALMGSVVAAAMINSYCGAEWSFDSEQEVRDLVGLLGQLEPYLSVCLDLGQKLTEALKSNRLAVFQGSQALALDVNYGVYPFSSSSHTGIAGLAAGAGIAPDLVPEHIAVIKPYLAQIGPGPFVTEEKDPGMEARLRQRGNEWENGIAEGDTVTPSSDKPIRVGWLDAVMLAHYTALNSITQIALTKLDSLDGLPTVKLGMGYMYQGQRLDRFIPRPEILAECLPVYEELPWGVSVRGITSFEALPREAKSLIARLEAATDTPISIIRNGPANGDVIFRKF
jgi:adenylosuccinate synthase